MTEPCSECMHDPCTCERTLRLVHPKPKRLQKFTYAVWDTKEEILRFLSREDIPNEARIEFYHGNVPEVVVITASWEA